MDERPIISDDDRRRLEQLGLKAIAEATGHPTYDYSPIVDPKKSRKVYYGVAIILVLCVLFISTLGYFLGYLKITSEYLNRLGILLNFLAGFLIAPDLLGVNRLKYLENKARDMLLQTDKYLYFAVKVFPILPISEIIVYILILCEIVSSIVFIILLFTNVSIYIKSIGLIAVLWRFIENFKNGVNLQGSAQTKTKMILDIQSLYHYSDPI